jgi:hypothetical protein
MPSSNTCLIAYSLIASRKEHISLYLVPTHMIGFVLSQNASISATLSAHILVSISPHCHFHPTQQQGLFYHKLLFLLSHSHPRPSIPTSHTTSFHNKLLGVLLPLAIAPQFVANPSQYPVHNGKPQL